MPSIVRRLSRRSSGGSAGSSHSSDDESKDLPPPVLVYHASARSIVFRDQLRRAAAKQNETASETASMTASVGDQSLHLPSPMQDDRKIVSVDKLPPPFPPRSPSTTHHLVFDDDEHKHVDRVGTLAHIASEIVNEPEETVLIRSEGGVPEKQIAGYMPKLQPLPQLETGPNDEFAALLEEQDERQWTPAEREVVEMIRDERACVKTVKNTDWTCFLHRFLYAEPGRFRVSVHDDVPPNATVHHFNAFFTSTTLLPSMGLKMRCYGSTNQYTVGVIFALPEFASDEEEIADAQRTETWSWPSGYSAKTEFNRDSRGRLINGREEALVSLPVLREYNAEYVQSDEYTVSGRRVSGLSQVPYSEVYIRVGGLGRIVNGKDVATGEPVQRSFAEGVGLPVALFIRTATFGNLMSLLRTRARLTHVWGEKNVKGIPLLMVSPTLGTRVLTDALQKELWKIAARQLNPFQNSSIAHKTSWANTDEESFQQKVEELIDLDESIREILTPEELAHIAGGFGATDESVAAVLKQVLNHDRKVNKESGGKAAGDSAEQSSHKLQDVVNEGLASAVRSGDYHTARQLLILYSLVAAQPENDDFDDESSDDSVSEAESCSSNEQKSDKAIALFRRRSSSMGRESEGLREELAALSRASSTSNIPPPPPPPPLDTDRLRSATNSDGLLAVLGAAQVLKAMQDGTAKRRVEEAIAAVEEWVNYGEQSVAFRISSWYDQRAAQGDLKIATDNNSSFMAFVSNKAIANRKAFAQQLRETVAATDFSDIRFLKAINDMLSKMHSPCLRLELLQYILGLDNRFSVAHVARSVELAATCLGLSTVR